MSWLEEDERDFRFSCPKCEEDFIVTARAKDGYGPGSKEKCPDCGTDSDYAGLVPIQLKSGTAIEGEQNGRKYMEYNDGRGGVRRISKTKLEYLKTGQTNGVYSKAYKEHLNRAQVSSAAKGALKE